MNRYISGANVKYKEGDNPLHTVLAVVVGVGCFLFHVPLVGPSVGFVCMLGWPVLRELSLALFCPEAAVRLS